MTYSGLIGKTCQVSGDFSNGGVYAAGKSNCSVISRSDACAISPSPCFSTANYMPVKKDPVAAVPLFVPSIGSSLTYGGQLVGLCGNMNYYSYPTQVNYPVYLLT
jgi:hypothetical protein